MKLVEAARIRMEDAQRKIEGKTVALESLGKARGFVDFVLGMGGLVSTVRALGIFCCTRLTSSVSSIRWLRRL